MRSRTIVLLVLVAAVVAAVRPVLSGQSPRPAQSATTSAQTVLVTSDGNLNVAAWRPAVGALEKTWEARLPLVDSAAREKRQQEAFPFSRDATLAIGDYDADGANDLMVMDAFGITIYGRTPMYRAFDRVALSSPAQAMAAADVDGDGRVEIVTQRTVPGTGPVERQIEVLKPGAAGLTSAWKHTLPGSALALAVGDVNNDRQIEIVAAGPAITVFARKPGSDWEVAGEVATISSVNILNVADVDGDGRNELLAGGSSGKLTVFKARKVLQKDSYPVLWQSPSLMPAGMKSSSRGFGPSTSVQALAVADVDGDTRQEIVVATADEGRVADKDIGGDKEGGRLLVYRFDGNADFVREWTSGWVPSATIGGLTAADIDGDGGVEFALNGGTVYRRDAGANTYRPIASACAAACGTGAIGSLGELREPASATRIVPLFWNVGRRIAEGQALDAIVSLRSAWTDVKNLTMTVTSPEPGLEVSNGSVTVASLPAGQVVALPPVRITGRKAGAYVPLRFDIAADGGYRQSFTARVFVSRALPTYEPSIDRAVAEALARAQGENTRVLIAWGSNSDPASKALLDAAARDSELSTKLLYEYDVVRADASTNLRTASRYGAKYNRAGLPYLTILDANGKALANQPLAAYRADTQAGPAYDATRLVEFLATHQASRQDGNKLLAAALGEAKAQSKSVLIWFSSPG